MATSAPTHHRKIDLQSAADLAYLQRNIHAAARQKIDLHFPPAAALADGMGGGDSLRGRVEEMVHAVSVAQLVLVFSLGGWVGEGKGRGGIGIGGLDFGIEKRGVGGEGEGGGKMVG